MFLRQVPEVDRSLTQVVHATADVIVNAVTQYLETTASPPPEKAKIAGSTCDRASVMLGRENGVMAQLKVKIPGFISHTLFSSSDLYFLLM